jgi:beta-glucanase (GH16 family)
MLKTSTITLALLVNMTITAAPNDKWVLAWHDEFNGRANTAPDEKKWTHDVGGNGWGNHELEEYTDKTANAFLDGHGHLAIRAIRTEENKYTSARLKTERRFEVKYGKIEARIKITGGQGLWPAFWLLGNTVPSVGWPECGEIDVMENIGKEPDTVHGTVHGPGYAGGKAITSRTKDRQNNSFSKGFHVYGAEWSSQRIIFYLDGSPYSTVTRGQVPKGSKWVFDHPFFLLLNLAVGGDWPGNPDHSTQFPQTMLIDWVRVWKPIDANKPHHFGTGK